MTKTTTATGGADCADPTRCRLLPSHRDDLGAGGGGFIDDSHKKVRMLRQSTQHNDLNFLSSVEACMGSERENREDGSNRLSREAEV